MRRAARWLLPRLIGDGGLMAMHRLYHKVLWRTGQFGLPESPATLALLAAFATRAGSILDIGANVGRYSGFFARHRRARTVILAFEPNPEPAALLRSTLADLPDLHVFSVALGDENGTVELTVPTDSFGNTVSGLGWIGPAPGGGIPVPVRRLDDLLAAEAVSLRPPVFVKLDVEGYEPAVLAGALRLLEWFRPVLYFESDPATTRRAGFPADAVFHRLAASGYTIVTELEGRFVVCAGTRPGHPNYIAVPSSAVSLPVGTRVTGEVVASWMPEPVEHGHG